MYSVLQPKVKESYLVTDEYDVGITLKLFRKECIFSFSRKQVALFLLTLGVGEVKSQELRAVFNSSCSHQCVVKN